MAQSINSNPKPTNRRGTEMELREVKDTTVQYSDRDVRHRELIVLLGTALFFVSVWLFYFVFGN